MASIHVQLEALRAEADFAAVIVADSRATLVTAAYAKTTQPETVRELWEMAARAVTHTGGKLERVREAIFYDWDGRQVVCRPFRANQTDYLLILLTPPKKAYKQAAGKIVRALEALITENAKSAKQP
jgi:hypothetical protein